MRTGAKKIPPGPKSGLLGPLREARKDPLRFLLRLALEYGGIARFRIAHVSFTLLSDLDAIKRVLQDNLANYVKGVSYEHLRTVMGQGLLVSEGEVWKRQRRLIQPAFHRRRLLEGVGTMTESISRLLERWEPRAESGRPFDVVPDFMRLAFDVVGNILMGTDIGSEMDVVERVLNEASDHVYRRMESPFRFPESVPTRHNRRFKNAVETINRVVRAVIEKHRHGAHDRGSLLSTLLAAQDEETGQAMSDRQLRDEVMTFLLAGHETTGDALCWTFYLLSLHPTAERRLQEEVDRVLGGRTPTAEDLPRLVYAGRVVDEGMRLFPPAWAFTRTVLREDELCGYPMPPRANIIISPYVNHRLPHLWDNPEAFDPDRFSPEEDAARHIYAYFPFGGGPHTCIGRHFSLLEVKLATAMIAQRFRLLLFPGQRIEPAPRISLRPSDRIMMILKRR